MLEIYVYGDRENGFLDLPANATLDVEGLADAFDENFTVGEFSLPTEAPWTGNNRKLLGFAERIANAPKGNTWWRCNVLDSGVPVFVNAKMTLLEKKGKYNYTSGSFNFSISGTKGLFGSLIRNKKLSDLQLGGPITFNSSDSRTFANNVMNGTENGYPYLGFAPVGIENFFDKDRNDYNGEFLAGDIVNYVVVNGSSWTFGRPTAADPTIAAASGNAEYVDYRTVPFFKLKFVLQKVFEEFGYTLKGDFITSTDFDDLFMYNNVAIDKYNNGYQDYNHSIIPGNHMPDKLISDFLKGVFSFFNMYPTFTGINEVTLVYRKNDFKTKNILSLNDVIGDSFESSFANQYDSEGSTDDISNREGGYKLNYKWDSNDQYYSDRVKEDMSDKTLVGTVATFGALGFLDIGRQLTTDDIAFVQADNLYYQVADATSTPIKWDVYAEELNSYIEEPATRSVDCDISTLCSYVEFNESTGLYEKRNCVGTRQAGSYINNRGVKVVNPFDLRIFFIKKIDGIPVSTNHNRDANNNKILPYSLAWNGEDGMAKNFHLNWQNMQENMEVIKTSVKVNQKIITDLLSHNVYEANGVLFFPYKFERTIPLSNSMDLYIVPL